MVRRSQVLGGAVVGGTEFAQKAAAPPGAPRRGGRQPGGFLGQEAGSPATGHSKAQTDLRSAGFQLSLVPVTGSEPGFPRDRLPASLARTSLLNFHQDD